MSDAKEEFWDRLDDVQAGMLGLIKNGETVPMSPNLRDDDGKDGNVWFITAKGTDLVKNTESGAQEARFVVADAKSGLYANIEGELSQSHDKAILNELWSLIAAAWFEGGKEDPDLVLLCFKPKKAAAWFSTTNPAKFLYEIAKANLTDEMPDTGWQADIGF